jgi:hypothetical protein
MATLVGLVFLIAYELPLLQFRMFEELASTASLCDESLLSASKLRVSPNIPVILNVGLDR